LSVTSNFGTAVAAANAIAVSPTPRQWRDSCVCDSRRARANVPCGNRVSSTCLTRYTRIGRGIFFTRRSSVLKYEARVTFQQVADAPCDVYSARFREAFQSRRYIDAVAVDVSAFDNYVAGIDADAEPHAAICRCPGIAIGRRSLGFIR
jgi:hypothetical protein